MRNKDIFEKLKIPNETRTAVTLGKHYKEARNMNIALEEVKKELTKRYKALDVHIHHPTQRVLSSMITLDDSGDMVITIPADRLTADYAVIGQLLAYLKAAQEYEELSQAIPHIDTMKRNIESQAIIEGQADLAARISESEPLTALSLKEVKG